MAIGMEFYKQKNVQCFNDSDETIKFTYMMNNIFDALNRRYPKEGIKKNSKDLEVFFCICVVSVLHACVSRNESIIYIMNNVFFIQMVFA